MKIRLTPPMPFTVNAGPHPHYIRPISFPNPEGKPRYFIAAEDTHTTLWLRNNFTLSLPMEHEKAVFNAWHNGFEVPGYDSVPFVHTLVDQLLEDRQAEIVE